ncbi:hypothetical protein BJ875DRAFT_443757 [Amylocarpus encephaloides]|uniref:Uncharacterized protein n=1 Tax=Amylocarpus encephaloides TaxID=45428 RepID=A0A9P8C494_9HELO|nr:hypothetical protein BJ875DRAFT_443757 [Amylocarpus encephaloides]
MALNSLRERRNIDPSSLTPPLLNSRASTPITDVCGSANHKPVPQIPNNANGNINPLLSMPDTAAPVGDNTIRSSPPQSFTIISNSVTESSEVCNVASEYDVIEVEDLIDLDEGSHALEANFVFVGGSLDSDLRNILDREELPDSHISGAYSYPGNGSTECMPTSHQDLEYQQPGEQAVQETSPSAVDPEDN